MGHVDIRVMDIDIDLETRSDVDLSTAGVYAYAESSDFNILTVTYAINGGEMRQVDLLNGDELPDEFISAVLDDRVIKWAHNATFERICLSVYLRRNYPNTLYDYDVPEDVVGNYLSPTSWRCSMVWAAYMGLPLSLKGAGAVLGLDEQKMDEGKALIKHFCVPHYTKDGKQYWHTPKDSPEKWGLFLKYNQRDVEVEMSIRRKLEKYPVPDFVWDEYHLSEEINDRGIRLEMGLVRQAIQIDSVSHNKLLIAMQNLTGLDNPNSVQQMKQWLADHGVVIDSLGKKEVNALLQTAPAELREVLSLRLQLAKSSVKKYTAMQNAACADYRARGMFMFYGANRTGRFSGRIIQLQNLPQNHMPDLDEARGLVKNGDYEMMELLYDSVPEVLSQLIRTAFVPADGYQFIVADFAAIEARVIAWIAGEAWRMEVFENGGDIYCASAAQMFGVPVVKHGVNGHLRQKGKIAELALGYGGSVGALKAMGAIEMGLQEEELQPLVDAWRESNPNITRLWWNVDRAVKDAIVMKTETETHGIRFICKNGMLFIELPSGRRLAYVKPKIGENKFGGESVTYEGIGANKKWERIESYGPKFVENIVQAIARDLLCNAMKALRDQRIVAHVHDELIIECKEGISLDAVCQKMAEPPAWARGLLLRADGYECAYYRKD